jgi:hypothetical protein
MIYNKEEINNIILCGILKLLKNDDWQGTMTDLNYELVRKLRNNSLCLPRSPSALRVALNRVVFRLRKRGVSVKFGRTTDRMRTRYVKFSIK